MAIAVPPAANVIQAWPLFTAYDTTGYPLIGGRLWTFAANTSTPKATYGDPFLLVPNTNPVVLSADGNALVYLDGFYRLVLIDAQGVQLWEVDNYEFPSSTVPPAGGGIFGMTEGAIAAVNGESVLQVPNLVPLGYRVEGVILRNDTPWGASLGLQAIQIGDAILQDGWGQIALDAALTTGQQHFRRGDRPIAATAYTVLLAAIGGRFDGAGSATVRAFWSSIGGWA